MLVSKAQQHFYREVSVKRQTLNQILYERTERKEDEQSHESAWRCHIFTDKTPGQKTYLEISRSVVVQERHILVHLAPQNS